MKDKRMSRVELRDRVEALRVQAAKLFHHVSRSDIQLWRRVSDAEYSLYCLRVLLAAPLPGEFNAEPSELIKSETGMDAVDG